MALTSRLELEVDSGAAEQNVVNIRKALAELEAQGLRMNNVLGKSSSEFGNLALSLSRAQAANDKAAASTGVIAQSAEDAAKAFAKQRKELDSLLGSIDPLTKQLNKLADQELALAKARDSGKINTATFDDYNRKLQENLNALTGATKAQQSLGESAEAAKARILAVAQASIDAAQAQRGMTSTATGLSEAQQGLLSGTNAVSAAQAKEAASSEKAASAMKQAGVSARSQTDNLQDLLASIDPVTKGLNRLDEQERQLAKFKPVLDAETFAKYQGVIDQSREALARLDSGLGRTGATAKQTSAALRQLPAQFSDIFVSLQAGQAPLTVFLQQGSQIKDSFGGIGAASKALGGYLIGLVNPLTVSAAAAAALVAIFVDAEREVSAFNKALFSGTASSGQTAASLAAISKSASTITGDISEANAAVIALAGSAKLSTTQFINLAQASTSIAEFSGKSAADVAKSLGDVGDSATKAAEKISAQYGLVTSAQYEVIAALDEQGKKQEALDALSGFLNENAQKRLAAYKASLSDIERDWNNIGTAISNAYSRIRSELFPDLAKQAEIIERILKTRENGGLAGALSTGLSKVNTALGLADGDNDDSTEALKAKLALIKQRLAVAQQTASLQGEEDRADQARIAADKDWNTLAKKELSDQAKLQEDIKDARLKGVAAGKSQAEIDKVIADIQAKYDKSQPKAKVVPVDLTGFNDAENKLKSLTASYQDQFRLLDAAEKSGLINADDYALQKGALLEKEKSQVESAYQAEIAALEAVSAKSSTTSAQRIGIDQKIADARSKMVDTLKKLDTDQEVLSQQTSARNARDAASLKAFTESVQDSLALAQQGLDNQLAGIGLGQEGRQRLQDDLKIRQDYQKQIEKLDRDYRNLTNPSAGQTDNYNKETQILKDALAQRLAAQQDYYVQLKKYQSDWTNGANAAFQDYISESQDIAGQTYSLFSDSLHGIEDAFVDAATTGKLSFKDLADSIIADLARIVAKAYIVTPILAALGIGGDSASSGGGLGSLVGGGSSGGGIMGLLTNVKNVVSVAGSNFGKAIISGWNSGDGVLGGLQTAFTNGADYLGSTITSAFSTGSTTAAQIASNYGASVAAGSSIEGYTGSQFGSYVASQNAASSLSALSATLSYVGAVYAVIQSYQAYGAKGAATTAGFAAAGAAIGSIVPVIGTALGAAIGAVIGSFVSSKAFGSGEKYPDLSTSAQGTYSGGKYTTGGIVQGWQTNAPKYGDNVDLALDATVNKFATTLGNLYTAFGSATQVYAYDLLQVRKTSGKYSTTFGATIDGGGADNLNIHQQFDAADAAEALQHNYDDIMGTFLAKAIVSSKSLPDYFRAQFTEFANDWDTTADEVIKAIEGVFTRFNGVNDALTLINVNNLQLDNTGLMASDSILNMIGAMSDLDTTTATAKEKVDALNKAVGTYYQAFFTADEQFADLTKSLKGAFEGFGLELPETRSAYRAMVEDIDVTTAAGQAMFATLVGLASNADSYYSTLDQKAKDAQQAAAAAAQAITDALMKGANDAYSALQRSIAAQQKSVTDAYNARVTSLNDMLSTANTSVSDLSSVANDLGSALKSLRGDSDEAVKVLRAQAQATLQSALSTARAGGSLANVTGLSDALDTVSSNSTDLYSSLEDFNRDQGRTANVVAELNLLNGKQLTSSEQAVKTLQDQLYQAKDAYDAQMAQYDAQLAFGQSQLDALNGVDNSILGVTSAINAMNAAVVAALQGQAKGAGAANTSGNNSTLVSSLYKTVLGRDADAAGASYWGSKLQSGQVSYQDAATQIAKEALALDASKYTGSVSQAQIAASKAAALAYLHSNNVPGYASGGNFGGGIRLVGEKGPEIELTGPSRIISNSAAAKALSGNTGSQQGVIDAISALQNYLYMITKYSEQTASGIRRQNEMEEAA